MVTPFDCIDRQTSKLLAIVTKRKNNISTGTLCIKHKSVNCGTVASVNEIKYLTQLTVKRA